MKLREPFPSRAIEHFGSQGFTHMRIARGDVQVPSILLLVEGAFE